MDLNTILNYVVWYKIHIIYGVIIFILLCYIMYKIYNDIFGVRKLKREFYKLMKPFKKKVKKEKKITILEAEEIEKKVNELKEVSQRVNNSLAYAYNISNNKKINLLERLYKLDLLIEDFFKYVNTYKNQLIEYETINERPPLDANVRKRKEYEKKIKVKSKLYDNDHKGLLKEGFEKDRHIYNETETIIKEGESNEK